MELPPARVGPYVRALGAALHALAPNEIWPDLAAMLRHLGALDPATSGSLLLPAEVDDRSGMPAYAWVERARAEAEALHGVLAIDARDVDRARAVDPHLADRLAGRRQLQLHLARGPLMSTHQTVGRLRRLAGGPEVEIWHDRILPDGTWQRTTAVLRGAGRDLGAVRVGEGARLDLDPGLSHLFGRHAASPLPALWARLGAVTEGEVRHVGRGTVGPFWFTGVPRPEDLPAEVASSLVLHLVHEALGDEIRGEVRQDPISAASLDAPARHLGSIQARRFAAPRGACHGLRLWAAHRGVDAEIVPFG